MKLLFRLVLTLVIAWLGAGMMSESVSASPTPEVVHIHTYDHHHHAVVRTYITTERGPPAAHDHIIAYDAADRWSAGNSMRPHGTTLRSAYGYNHRVTLAQVARAPGRTREPHLTLMGDSSSPDRSGVAANAATTFGRFGAADIRAAAGAADRNGLTRAGRALQKHSGRDGSAYSGLSSGNAIARNRQGMEVVDEIIGDPRARTEVLDNVTNIWDSTGRGLRLRNDGTFMGFLEPLP